jgi:type IX secretion system PorP/SprF family membrane protein
MSRILRELTKASLMNKIYSIVVLCCIALTSTAQDLHFSQYYAYPVTLNPALTGKFEGLYRVNAIYRAQDYGVTPTVTNSAYRTPAISVDFSLFKEKMKGSALGVGLGWVNDLQRSDYNTTPPAGVAAVPAHLSSNTIYLSLAYTLQLNKKKSTQLSLGFTPSYSLRSMQGTFTFPDGFDASLNYTPTKDDNLVSKSPSKNYFNLAAGMFFNTNPISWMTLYAGYSMGNIVRPSASFLGATVDTGRFSSADKLPIRHVVHAGIEFAVSKKILLTPGFLYQNMAKSNETNVGLTASYVFSNKEVNGHRERGLISLGLWNRIGSDVNSSASYRNITPKLSLDYANFRVGVAYDIDLGARGKDAASASPKVSRPQAFELALSYMGFGSKPLKEGNWLFNPRY